MRVFVAGGAGVIGRYLIPQLTADGHQVTATTRTPGKAARLHSLGGDGHGDGDLDRARTGGKAA